MPRELPRTFDPAEIEPRIYQVWEQSGCFTPSGDADRRPFCVTIPPPNVTGELHMGHALQHSIHDLLIRRRRMQGFDVLCLPGTDHAGIGTQMKVEQALRQEGTDRHRLGRAGFIRRAQDWTLRYGGAILGQLRALGCSYDWTRLRFTLDEIPELGPDTAGWALGALYTRGGYARAVLESFVRFYQRGWIYRGERIVNWCPECRTVVSDLEVEHREIASHLWHIRYPAADGGPGVTVATTRPETMLGDTGVAVHPSDDRYRALVGSRVILPLADREIPVVADPHVDPDFGRGALKVTPGHDVNDWEIGMRHPELLMPAPSVIDEQGCMIPPAPARFVGLTREECRAQVVEELEKQGLLVQVEDYTQSVGHHDRCGTRIESLLKLQWWADCTELARKARAAIESGRVAFTPERFAQMEVDWLSGIRPWCVSRQLWWGHRIPLWYCTACDPGVEWGDDGSLRIGEAARPVASVDRPGACPRCGGTTLEQDPDVLDTWFSSALWPLATLGWPEPTQDLARFYPTDLMITGRDILHLWVARMIWSGEEFLGAEPFRRVLVHATVMTEDGKRMSKSLGTGVDPLELIRLYGADATRFGLISLATESQDVRFKIAWKSGGKTAVGPDDELARAEQIEQMRNFCTKLWNVSRFVLLNMGDGPLRALPLAVLLADPRTEPADRWIASRFNAAAAEVNDALDRYALGEAAWRLYHFVWDEFADWYVELAKPRLRSEDPQHVRELLQALLEATLRLAHPFLPFLTEEVWQSLPGRPAGQLLMTQRYPGPSDRLHDPAAEEHLSRVIEVSRTIRNMKAALGVPNREVPVRLEWEGELETRYVESSARCRLIAAAPEGPGAHDVAAGVRVTIPLAGLVDADAERARLDRELAALDRELEGVARKLDNEQFVSRAPAEVVEKQRRIREELLEKRNTLRERRRLFGEA